MNPPAPTETCCTAAKAHILAAAERLFSARGYDGVSINAVAMAAGVSKANVFHHFGSKEDLYLAVLENVRQGLSQELFALSHAPERDFDDTLHEIAETYLGHMLAEGERARLFIRELLERRPIEGKTLAERLFGPNFGHIVGLLRRGQEQGRIREEVNAAMPALVLVATCVFFLQTQEIIRHLPGMASAGNPQDFTRMVVDILLRGIATPDTGTE